MNHSEIVKAVLELAIIGIEIYFIAWTIRSIKKLQEKQNIIWEEIQQLRRDGRDYYKEIENTKGRIKKIEEKMNDNTPE